MRRSAWLAAAATAGLVVGLVTAGSSGAGADPVPRVPYQDCSSEAGNLVANCGFETGDFADWTVTPAISGSSLQVFGFNQHSGAFAAGFGADDSWDDYLSQQIAGTVSGHTYVLSYWLRNDNTGARPDHFSATVSDVQGGGSDTFDEQTDVDGAVFPDTGPYIYYQDTFVAGATAPTLTFAGQNFTSAWWLDDVAVTDAAQMIRFTSAAPAAPKVGDHYPASATGGGSGNPVLIIVDADSASVCSIDDSGLVTFTGVGTCRLDATQAGTAPWLRAPTVGQTIKVSKAPQTITITSAPPIFRSVGDDYLLTATGGASGNPVTFTIAPTSAAVCQSLDQDPGSTEIFFFEPGRCVIRMKQAGNAGYKPATKTYTIVVKAG